MRNDAETLARLLAPIHIPDDDNMAYRVFGSQTKQQKLSLEHSLNLLRERSALHERHIDDIERRHQKMQERLFGARLHGRADAYRRADRFEQTITQLDEQRRKEELAFWKDTAEIRDKLFEAGKEYQALLHRTSLLSGLEPGDEVYA